MIKIFFFIFIIFIFLYCNNELIKGGNNNILEKIDKIYFINLDKSKDRLDMMLEYGKNLNLKLKDFLLYMAKT